MSSSRWRQRSSTTLPSWVSWTCRVVRCSSRLPSCASSCWTAAETVARGMSSRSAALVKLPVSATRRNTRMLSRRSMGRPLLSIRDGWTVYPCHLCLSKEPGPIAWSPYSTSWIRRCPMQRFCFLPARPRCRKWSVSGAMPALPSGSPGTPISTGASASASPTSTSLPAPTRCARLPMKPRTISACCCCSTSTRATPSVEPRACTPATPKRGAGRSGLWDKASTARSGRAAAVLLPAVRPCREPCRPGSLGSAEPRTRPALPRPRS